jgi:hypothetical protein
MQDNQPPCKIIIIINKFNTTNNFFYSRDLIKKDPTCI